MPAAVDTDRRAKKLEVIRGLLAKAESTEFEGEAAVFRAKADKLMDEYMVAEWELAKPGDATRKPVKRMYDMSWYRNEFFGQQLWDLLCTVAEHCRVQIANMYFTGREIPLVGLEPDLDYMDMLFTGLMLELLKRIQPKPSSELDYEHNLVMLKEAGLGWQEIAVRMYEAGALPFADEVKKSVHPSDDISADTLDKLVIRALKTKVKWYGRCAHAYRNWCKANNYPQSYTNYKTYRKNFATGFRSRVNERLREMRRAKEDPSDGNHAALVLRDIRHVVKDALLAEFPQQASKRAVAKYRRNDGAIDYAARNQGKAAANEAKIHVHQDRVLKKRGELPA